MCVLGVLTSADSLQWAWNCCNLFNIETKGCKVGMRFFLHTKCLPQMWVHIMTIMKTVSKNFTAGSYTNSVSCSNKCLLVSLSLGALLPNIDSLN